MKFNLSEELRERARRARPSARPSTRPIATPRAPRVPRDTPRPPPNSQSEPIELSDDEDPAPPGVPLGTPLPSTPNPSPSTPNPFALGPVDTFGMTDEGLEEEFAEPELDPEVNQTNDPTISEPLGPGVACRMVAGVWLRVENPFKRWEENEERGTQEKRYNIMQVSKRIADENLLFTNGEALGHEVQHEDKATG